MPTHPAAPVVVPAPRELIGSEGGWTTSDPEGEARRERDDGLAPSAYQVVVTPDGATLRAGSDDAMRWAEQTFRQLVPRTDRPGDVVTVPAVRIEDEPAFGWRGVMLDVARHFFPMSFLRQVVDLLAMHRLNVLHLHLTDDQGWRIQIEAYPRLTEVGAWRDGTMVGPMTGGQTEFEYDGVRHGGHYTQDELRDLVAYAAERGVTVVPEIDLPGHMQAAVAAYPELGNDPGHPVGVRREWGISEHVLAPTEAAGEFVRTVLREVLSVFDSPFVHIGGDECPTVQWRRSPVAQRRMAELGLTEPRELQGWFTQQAAQVLAEHGRRLVGWDEILQSARPDDAVVMAWRHASYGVEAARAGHDVVMAPSQTVYLDYYQADPATEPLAIGSAVTTLADVAAFEVVPAELDAAAAARVLGAQCQLWTEYVPDPAHAAYMLLPRMCAFAERAWGSPQRGVDELVDRLRTHLPRLEALGLSARPLDRPGSERGPARV